MSDIELRHISKRFKDTVALDDVSFNVADGELFVLLGHTGAGKTTTLRIIAGLERQDAGDVLFDGETVNQYTPADRDVAFVFQQYSLYPNKTVYENLAFPLRSPLRRVPSAEIDRRVRDAAEKLRITQLLERKTANLSGGEMQRVSIGRAIVRQPRVFLMDEPLSNLDAKLREALRIEIQHLQKTQGSTTLFVTHDQIEALTMADRIGVLRQGRIVQIGSPQEIYDHPTTTFVAQLVGIPRINLLPAARENGTLVISDSAIRLPLANGATAVPPTFLLGVRPEDVRIDPAGDLRGEVILTEPLGVETVVHIRSGRQTLLCLVPGITHLAIGDTVSFSIDRSRLHFFERGGQRVAN
ncbi:MAG TPA: ABC transporter ATP-binding protein [Aggregatilineaceae bacterium]|jgi:multiple sugar transport system ATP-binding protein|nr:ABC transporter ATP-binding protein [Aggregatilineaceae bacterium]